MCCLRHIILFAAFDSGATRRDTSPRGERFKRDFPGQLYQTALLFAKFQGDNIFCRVVFGIGDSRVQTLLRFFSERYFVVHKYMQYQ